MTPQIRRLLFALLALVGVAAIRRRPVKRPEPTGGWHPAEP
jgi:hypothetical protein